MSLTLRQLEYFIAVAESGQVSKAAIRCNVSQSSMTIALKNLEDTLGTALFTRHAKGLRLTDAGERFLRHAQQVASTVRHAVDDLQGRPEDLRGIIRIGVTETISAYLMPALLAAMTRRFPSLTVELVERERASVEQSLRDGKLEVALLLVSNVSMAEDLVGETLLRSPRRLWTNVDHPLQDAQRVTLADVARENYLLLDMDEHVQTVGKYWGKLGLAPRVQFQSTSIEAVRSLVALGQGVTILSDLVYRPWSLEGNRILRRDLSDPIPSMDVGVVWSRKHRLSAQTDGVLSYLRSSIKAMAGS